MTTVCRSVDALAGCERSVVRTETRTIDIPRRALRLARKQTHTNAKATLFSYDDVGYRRHNERVISRFGASAAVSVRSILKPSDLI